MSVRLPDPAYLRDHALICQLDWRQRWSSVLDGTDVGAGICAVMDLMSRVNNGGFDMYFRSDVVRSCARALAMLERIGASTTAQVLEDARALLGSAGPAEGHGPRQAQVDAMDPGEEAELNERFWHSGEELICLLAGLAREHLGELVVPYAHRPTEVRSLDEVDAAALEAHPVWVRSGIADYAYAWPRKVALEPWGLHVLPSFADRRDELWGLMGGDEDLVPEHPSYVVRATFTQPNGAAHVGRILLSKGLGGAAGWDVRFAEPVVWVGAEPVRPWLGARRELGDAEWAQLLALEAADPSIWPLVGVVDRSVCRTPPPPIRIDGYYCDERGVVRAVELP